MWWRLCRQWVAEAAIVIEEVTTDSGVVKDGADKHEAVPDGVRKWDDAVALEKHDAGNVDDTAKGHFIKTRGLFLFEVNKK